MLTDDKNPSVTRDSAAPLVSSARRRMTPGMRLGRYEILAPIGSGGMGDVHAARDTRLGRKVAIKVLEAGDGDDALRRFENEARVVAALNHPNILAVFDLGVFEGTPYIVFELLEGDTLRQRLVEGPLPLAEALDVAIQIARGLAAAHEKGIIHRDLKPENVFITRKGEVKVLDFGLAKLHKPTFGDSTLSLASVGAESGIFAGTVTYMSPEQARSQSIDLRTDLFSLGIVIHELVTGAHPFRAGSVADTLASILSREPAGAGLPAALEPIVRRCLSKLPADRFQTAADLIFTLEWLAGAAPVVLPAPPPVVRVPAAAANEAAPRVLVVDDDRMTQMLLRRNLAQAGYEVETAPDGPSALARLREAAYDLVILDFVMPTMDGYEVLGRITADERLREIPVVLVSGIDDKANAALLVEAGAADYLTKPVDGQLLRARAARCIESKRSRERERRLRGELEETRARLAESEAERERLIRVVEELRGGR